MKHLITCAVAILALTACNKQKNDPWNDSAMVSISPAQGVTIGKADLPENPERLSAIEVVKQAELITCRQPGQDYPPSRGINDDSRDFENVRLLMYSSDVIGQTGDLGEFLLVAEDVVFTTLNERNERKDTLAYVPNRVLRDAAVKIREAYAAKDYQTCYNLFEKAYTFIPITGAEWRELKARGEN